MTINAKKLNIFLSDTSNSSEMISLVKNCVEDVLSQNAPNLTKIAFLKDLGLLKNNKNEIIKS